MSITFKPNKSNKTKIAAGALLLAVMLALPACGGGGDSDANNGGVSPTDAVGDQLPEDNGIMEPGVPSTGDNGSGGAGNGNAANGGNASGDETPTSDNGQQGGSEPAVLKGEGVFSGIADSHSIEIMVDGKPEAFQVTDELFAVVNELPSDAKVKFEYTEKVYDDADGAKQLWLKSIEQID